MVPEERAAMREVTTMTTILSTLRRRLPLARGRRLRLLVAMGTITALGQLSTPAQAKAAGPAQGSPHTHQFLPPPGAFIADVFAMRGDGAQLAYVTAVGAKDLVLHVVDLVPPGKHLEVAALPGRVQSLLWLAPGRLLVVTRSGSAKRLMGRVFTGAGPEGPSIGPADHIALGTLEGNAVVTTFTRADDDKAGIHQVAAFDAVGLQPLASRKVVVDQQRRLEVNGQKLKLLWWGEDFTSAAVRKPGDYDQARDVRLPDRFGRVDLLSNTLVDEAAIEPAGFAQRASLQRLYPGKTLFVHMDTRNRKLLLVDGTQSHVLKPARPLQKYHLNSIRWQKVSDDRALVSLTAAPLDARTAATSGTPRNRHEIELYSVNRATGAMSFQLTLDDENRQSAWHVGGGKLALLRKHRVFSRGGVVLQVYSLPTTSAAR